MALRGEMQSKQSVRLVMVIPVHVAPFPVKAVQSRNIATCEVDSQFGAHLLTITRLAGAYSSRTLKEHELELSKASETDGGNVAVLDAVHEDKSGD